MDKRFQELNLRFSQIEQSLEHLRTNTTHITIESVHIHQPVLEKMEYRLDNLDIEQISGSLNLGNNFGAKINSPLSSLQPNTRQKTDITTSSGDRQPKPTHPASKPADSGLPGLQRTPTGYRITRN